MISQPSPSLPILIAGAGVLGLCTAVELKLRGHDVCVVDPGDGNASSVAAGMIAPGIETLLEGGPPERVALLQRGATLWPDFAGRTGIMLDQAPAVWRGKDSHTARDMLIAAGFDAQRLVVMPVGLSVGTDLRVDVPEAIRRLRSVLGPNLLTGRVVRLDQSGDGWIANLLDSGSVSCSAVILAIGTDAMPEGLAPDVRTLLVQIELIRGQIGSVPDGRVKAVVRDGSGYVFPVEARTGFGATMQPGRWDTQIDPVDSAALIRNAETLTGSPIDPTTVEWKVGIRGATPDGLPMAGRLDSHGLWAALAPRRNGWLLGPLVARIVADGIEGHHADADTVRLDPLRFA